MKSFKAMTQAAYVRNRENPFFKGLLVDDDALRTRTVPSDYQRSSDSQSISRSKSDIGNTRSQVVDIDLTDKPMDFPSESSVSKIIPQSFGRSSSESWSKIAKTTSFAFPSRNSDFSFDMVDSHDSREESSPILPSLMWHAIEKSYSLRKRTQNLSKIQLPQSAASFYNGYSQQMEIVESCESINRLNSYLKSCRDDVNAGVPGKFLHAVIGQDVSDVGSVASIIMYAFYLNQSLEDERLCTVPVINMKRAELISRAELKWLLDSCQIDQASLIFMDEVDLSYYDLFGSLKLVLLNGHKLPTKQEALKDAVVEIFNCSKGESVYPWVETVAVGQDCSCCTLVAEKFTLYSPEILSGRGFSRLLLAGILLDTGNLTNLRCTSKDKYMATLLLNGAGRFGCNGLYQIIRYKIYDVSNLKMVDILSRDFKKWTSLGKPNSDASRVTHIGMSSIGIPVERFLSHEDSSTQEIKYFQQMEKLRVLMIVSGYYDQQKNFKREILVSAESMELMKNLLIFLSNGSQLPLKVLHLSGLQDGMRAFEIDKVTSRKTIERLLEEFGGTSTTSAGS